MTTRKVSEAELLMLNDSRYKNPSARQLVLIAAWLKEHPEGYVPTGTWPKTALDADEWHAWFLRCLMAKINSSILWYGKGRKWKEEPKYRIVSNERVDGVWVKKGRKRITSYGFEKVG